MPLAVLQTRRLVLRPLGLADVEAVFRHASDPRVARFMAWPRHESRAASERFVKEYAFENYARGVPDPYAIARREAPSEFLGVVGCNFLSETVMELGYWLGEAWWGQGFTTEAARAVVDASFAKFPQVHRIEARHIRENEASGLVLGKLGMQREGVAREAQFKNGYHWDVVTWGILRREWLGRRDE